MRKHCEHFTQRGYACRRRQKYCWQHKLNSAEPKEHRKFTLEDKHICGLRLLELCDRYISSKHDFSRGMCLYYQYWMLRNPYNDEPTRPNLVGNEDLVEVDFKFKKIKELLVKKQIETMLLLLHSRCGQQTNTNLNIQNIIDIYDYIVIFRWGKDELYRWKG
jgi:hypothetical protein